MTGRPQLPAFGKALLQARREGRHPFEVVVIYGNDWRVSDDRARLAVKPGEALGRDWRLVAGIQVLVLDRSTAAEDDYDEAGSRELFFLVAEIARHAAWVTFETPEPLWSSDSEIGPGRASASIYAFCSRRWDAATRRFKWPPWWSNALDEAHRRNHDRWLSEVEKSIVRDPA